MPTVTKSTEATKLYEALMGNKIKAHEVLAELMELVVLVGEVETLDIQDGFLTPGEQGLACARRDAMGDAARHIEAAAHILKEWGV